MCLTNPSVSQYKNYQNKRYKGTDGTFDKTRAGQGDKTRGPFHPRQGDVKTRGRFTCLLGVQKTGETSPCLNAPLS